MLLLQLYLSLDFFLCIYLFVILLHLNRMYWILLLKNYFYENFLPRGIDDGDDGGDADDDVIVLDISAIFVIDVTNI